MRVLLALALVAPALAGCIGQGDTLLAAESDPSAPHCVGACPRIVDDSPVRAWEPFLAVDPKDPDHLVIAHSEMTDDFLNASYTLGKTRVSVTEDGGATWETRVVPGGVEAGPTHPLAGYASVGYDPVLVFLPDGTLVMSALASNTVDVPGVPVHVWPGLTVYTSRSTDGGRTWRDVRIVDQGAGVVAFDTIVGAAAGAMWKNNDKEWLALGPDGTLLLVWTQFTYMHPDDDINPLEAGGRLVFSSSEDGGLSWSPVRIVDGEGRGHGASPVIGRDGVWRVAYVDHASALLRFAESHDHGQTWEARTIGATSWIPVMRAQALASGVERLLLTYTTGGDERRGEHQIEFTWSDDGGATWAPALVVDTPQGEGAPMPDVVGAADDGAWMTYFDLEGPYAKQRSRYLAVKVAGGVAGEPLVLDDMEVAAANLGHYMGLAAAPDGDALAAWVTYDDTLDVVWARISAGSR